MILIILCLLVSIWSIILIYKIVKDNSLKGKEGMLLYGREVGCEVRWGTPTRYIVEVEYTVNDLVNRKRIVTTDKHIRKYTNDEYIPLIYVKRNNKVYWAEDKSIEKCVWIIILLFLCIFALVLAFVSVLVHFSRFDTVGETMIVCHTIYKGGDF